MSLFTLITASLRHYRGLHALVIGGVAVAVAVLAGALLVGSSVRASLRELALARLGATELVVSSTTFFREALAADIGATHGSDDSRNAPGSAPTPTSTVSGAVPILALTGAVTHEESRRTAARVNVFGIDDRFLTFHGRPGAAPANREAWISAGLAAEIGAGSSDALLVRIAKPTDIPLSTLQGRREDVSERIRLSTARVLDRASLGEFSLVPAQGPPLSIFVPLSRLQQDLGLAQSANAVLVRMASSDADPRGQVAAVQQLVAAAARLPDLGLTLRPNTAGTMMILEGRTGLLPDRVAVAAARAASDARHPSVRALTYLANAIRARGREIPYSLITAMDLAAYDEIARTSAGDALPKPPLPQRPSRALSVAPNPPILLNEWAADDLGVEAGDRVEVDYFLWSDQDGLLTRSAAFTFVGVVPMSGAGGDTTLTPEYPGITDASDVTSWDPPFPVDMQRVRKKDEEYWDRWRAAPKAFIPLEVGQRLWASPFGSLSSLRTMRTDVDWPPLAALDVFGSGLTVRHARAEALAAAEGTTDFGEYFVYFSFFIVVSGLLLAGLFFALSVEQRAKELGLLVAVGFGPAQLRRVLLGEAAIVTLLGSAIGVAGAVGYAAVIMYGLRTWWVDAVGTTALELHIDPLLVVAGAAGAIVAALVALALSMRRVARRTARTLLAAGLTDDEAAARLERHPSVPALIAVSTVAASMILAGLAIWGVMNQVAAFFGAGGMLLVAGCAALAAWFRRPGARSSLHTGVARFGAAYSRWRPTRSVFSTALIAFACFVIVSVGAFRRDPAGASLTRASGTGGFALMGESVAPLMHNPDTERGRDELSLAGFAELDGMRVSRFRLRPGDEASCLTLYQPTNPRIVAPEASFLEERRFSFARSLAETDAEREHPWQLLARRFADGAIPAIADQTTLQYVFHLGVGDDFVFTPEGSTPVRLRIVGSLADSVLQSELIIGEQDFVRLFPRHEGYRVWLIEIPAGASTSAVTTRLEDRLSDFGFDVTETRARLASYHRVENTYLSTFQALGALGLLIGTLGLGAVLARNVLERRRELGLLRAIGFTPRHLRTVITAEAFLLVAGGACIGTIAALVAVAPALVDRGSPLPLGSLALLLGSVVATGLLSSMAALRLATSVPIVEAIKNE